MAVISKRVDQRGNFQGIFDLQGSSVSAVPPPLPQCKHAWNGSARHPSLSVLKDPDLVEDQDLSVPHLIGIATPVSVVALW